MKHNPLFRRITLLILCLSIALSGTALAVPDHPGLSYTAQLLSLDKDGGGTAQYPLGYEDAQFSLLLKATGTDSSHRLYSLGGELAVSGASLAAYPAPESAPSNAFIFKEAATAMEGLTLELGPILAPESGNGEYRLRFALVDYSGQGVQIANECIPITFRFTAPTTNTTAEISLRQLDISNSDGSARPVSVSAPAVIRVGDGVSLPDKYTLSSLINQGRQIQEQTYVSTDGSEYTWEQKWVTQAEMDAFAAVLDAAIVIYMRADALQQDIEDAAAALEEGMKTFFDSRKPGTYRSNSQGEGAKRYHMVCLKSEGGTITVTAPISRAGLSQTFYITPDKGWRIADVYVNGVSVGPVRHYTVQSVSKDVVVSAVFVPLTDPALWVNPYRDVAEGAWYYEAVRDCTILGLVNGVDINRFAPGGTLTRAMFVTLLCRLDGGGLLGGEVELPFTDVNRSEWHYPAVAWAWRNHIVNGVAPDRFAPDSYITREEMATMLGRYLSYLGYNTQSSPRTGFADEESISPWALNSVRCCVEYGLLYGVAADRFAPKSWATRAEASALLLRLHHFVYPDEV